MASRSFQVEFGSTLSDDSEFKLFEVSEEVLKLFTASDGKLCFKGSPGGDVVLCTATNTYEVRQVETSNTCLLCPSPAGDDCAPRRVEASISKTYELILTNPRTVQLQNLLSEWYYTGPESSEDATFSVQSDTQAQATAPSTPRPLSRRFSTGEPLSKRTRKHRYTRDELREQVQCSDAELDAALRELNTVQVGEHVMLVAPDVLHACLDSLLTIADQSNWDLTQLTTVQCSAELMQFYDDEILLATLRGYADPVGPEEDGIWSINAPKVCVFRAKQLFTASESWKESEFMEQWRNTLPAGITPSIDMLRECALVENFGHHRTVKFFPRDTLPATPKERFGQLFRRRQRWRLDELRPFVADLVGPGRSLEQLLAKNCRDYQEAGVTMYTEL